MALSSQASRLISVILPCRNESKFIAGCLKSILDQRDVPGELEVIVADGMSDDGTRQILHALAQSDHRLKIIDNPGQIVATGLNAALSIATGAIIIRMDAHTAFAPDYIQRCIEALDSTGADNVGGPWVAKGSGGLIGDAVAVAFESAFAVGGARGHNSTYEGYVDTVYLGCWRRELFDRVGLFDEELVRNQDDEFNLRLTSRGGRIWQSPTIKSWYTPRNSLGALFSQYRQYGYWKVRVIRKYGRPASMRHLVPAAFMLSLPILLAASFWYPPAGGLFAGLVALYLFAAGAFAISAAGKGGWRIVPVMPVVFACFHFGYACGFLGGLADAFGRRSKPSRVYTDLTRSAVAGPSIQESHPQASEGNRSQEDFRH